MLETDTGDGGQKLFDLSFEWRCTMCSGTGVGLLFNLISEIRRSGLVNLQYVEAAILGDHRMKWNGF